MPKPRLWYLAGPIQHISDYVTWRVMMEKFLESIGDVGLQPFGVKMAHKNFRKLLRNASIEEKNAFSHYRIVPYDLTLVDICTGIIINAPKGVSMCGTWGEMTVAKYRDYMNYDKVEILIRTDIPKKDMPNWMLGCQDRIFKTWAELKAYLRNSKWHQFKNY